MKNKQERLRLLEINESNEEKGKTTYLHNLFHTHAHADDLSLSFEMLRIEPKFLLSGMHDKIERVPPSHAAALCRVGMVQPRVTRADAQSRGVAVEHHALQAVHRQPRQCPATVLREVVQQVRALGVQTQITRRVGGVDSCVQTRKLRTVREIT